MSVQTISVKLFGSLASLCLVVWCLAIKEEVLERWYIHKLECGNEEIIIDAVNKLSGRRSRMAAEAVYSAMIKCMKAQGWHERRYNNKYLCFPRALRRMGEIARPEITKMLKDTSEDVQWYALEACDAKLTLSLIGDILPMLDEWKSCAPIASYYLEQLGYPAIPYLEKTLCCESRNAWARITLCQITRGHVE